MSRITVVAAVVDEQQITLYKPDGNTLVIPQGDPRVQRIIGEVLPLVDQGHEASIDLTIPNPYGEFEEKGNGLVRFFRVAKSKVAKIFAAPSRDVTIEPGTHGSIPVPQKVITEPASRLVAVDEIVANAKPASGPDFDEGSQSDDETMVAVVGDTVIPGVEAVKEHLRYSANLGSTKGMEAFFARIAPVIKQRAHSVQDILTFMERNDLPIADDGCLLVYKVLKKRDGVYRDCHTGLVPQKIGSFVCVDPKLIDLNRRNECSAGLHVARRGYIGGFHGDCCTLVKVAPEDVYVVPHGDPDKVRVRGYHILFELDQDSWSKLRRNVPMTSNPGASQLLGQAIKGNHVRRLEEVLITQQRGGGVQVTPLNEKGERIKTQAPAAKALDDSPSAPKVDPRRVDEQVAKRAAQTPVSAPTKTKPMLNSRQQHARDLYEIVATSTDPTARKKAAGDLLAFKKKTKVSWESLGILDVEATHVLTESTAKVESAVEMAKKVVAKAPEKVKGPAQKTQNTKKATKPAPKPASTPVEAPVQPEKVIATGRKQRLYDLCKVWNESSDWNHKAEAAKELVQIRKGAKKTWASLGYPEFTDQLLLDFVAKGPPVEGTEVPESTAPASDWDAEIQAEAEEEGAEIPALKPVGATNGNSRLETARNLFDNGSWSDLYELKRRAKVSWLKLGFSANELSIIEANKPKS